MAFSKPDHAQVQPSNSTPGYITKNGFACVQQETYSLASFTIAKTWSNPHTHRQKVVSLETMDYSHNGVIHQAKQMNQNCSHMNIS